MKVIPETRYAH